MKKNSPYYALLAVMGIAVAARIAAHLVYAPLYGNDSREFSALADMIRTGNTSGYDAWRTPGYPVFMLLCGLDNNLIWMAQALLGVATSVLAAAICYMCSRSTMASFAAGAFVATLINLLFYEAIIQSESVSVFLLTAICFAIVFTKTFQSSRKLSLYVIALLIGAAILVRPALAILGPVATVILFCRIPTHRIIHSIAFTMIWMALPTGWCIFNLSTVGYFTLSTTTGLNILNHTGMFIECADNKYDDLKQAYITARDDAIDQGVPSSTGDNRSFIRLPPAVSTNLTPAELSDKLTKMSVSAIKNCPHKYAISVAAAWLRYWRGSLILYPELLVSQELYPPLYRTWLAQKGLLIALYVVFMASFALHVIKRRPWEPVEYLACIVLALSLFQALLEYGGNSRYAIPSQPLAVVCAIVSIARFSKERSTANPSARMASPLPASKR